MKQHVWVRLAAVVLTAAAGLAALVAVSAAAPAPKASPPQGRASTTVVRARVVTAAPAMPSADDVRSRLKALGFDRKQLITERYD